MGNVLETRGLVPAIEAFSSQLASTASFQVHLEADQVPRLRKQAGSAILGVIKEAVGNAKAHAQAANLWITVRCQKDALEVSVRDDGQGFDFEAVKAKYKAQGVEPASNMSSRVEAIQGRFDMQSAVGEGTTVHVVAPLAPNLKMD